jgi:hypothetical protein
VQAISLVTTANVDRVEALLAQNARRKIATLTDLAIHGDLAIGGKFTDATPKFVYGNISGVRKVAASELFWRANVQ